MRLLLILLLHLGYNSTFACECWGDRHLNDKNIIAANIIIKGKIQHIDTLDNYKILHVIIERKYKGSKEINEKSLIIIKTPKDTSVCGLNVSVNQNWLFLAYQNYNGLFTDACSRSQNINSSKKEDQNIYKYNLAFLERKRNLDHKRKNKRKSN